MFLIDYKDAWRLKERKAELDKALQQPLGEIWVASNRPVPAAKLATQYGKTQFATPEEAARFAQACAEKLQGRDINAVYLLAETAAPNAARTNVKDMVYLGAFAIRTGDGGTTFDAEPQNKNRPPWRLFFRMVGNRPTSLYTARAFDSARRRTGRTNSGNLQPENQICPCCPPSPLPGNSSKAV